MDEKMNQHYEEAIEEMANYLNVTTLKVEKDKYNQPIYFIRKWKVKESTFDVVKRIVFDKYDIPMRGNNAQGIY